MTWRVHDSRRRRDERGSVAIEAAIGVPAFGLFVAMIILGGRVEIAKQAVEAAAYDAARAASIERTQPLWASIDRTGVGDSAVVSHQVIFPSHAPLTACVPSFVKASDRTQVECPPVRFVFAPSANWNRLTTTSSEPPKTNRPSGSIRHAFSGRSCFHSETT